MPSVSSFKLPSLGSLSPQLLRLSPPSRLSSCIWADAAGSPFGSAPESGLFPASSHPGHLPPSPGASCSCGHSAQPETSAPLRPVQGSVCSEARLSWAVLPSYSGCRFLPARATLLQSGCGAPVPSRVSAHSSGRPSLPVLRSRNARPTPPPVLAHT